MGVVVEFVRGGRSGMRGRQGRNAYKLIGLGSIEVIMREVHGSKSGLLLGVLAIEGDESWLEKRQWIRLYNERAIKVCVCM